MPQLAFVTLDVFTTTRYVGNPLAVVRIANGQDVSTEQMLKVANEFNLSETLFIHEQTTGTDGTAEWRVRIFVTTAEIPFAGHPTIGAAVYALGTLAPSEKRARLICNAGPIEIAYDNGLAKAEVPHNFHKHTEHEFTVEDVYNLHPSLRQLDVKLNSIDIVSPVKGMNFICTELPDLDALSRLETDGPEAKARLDSGWEEGWVGSFLYVIMNQPSKDKPEVTLRTRMLSRSKEDAATGSASCGLSAFLALKWKLGRMTSFKLTQGVEMGRQSDIGVVITLDESLERIEKMELTGSAVKVMEGMLEI